MSSFDKGSLFTLIATGLIFIAVTFGTSFTEVTYQQTQEAVGKCKDGKWEKIDNTTIYCTDGADYPFGE